MTEFYRRKLPHWQPEGAMYFITFRLAGSLPDQVIQELMAQRECETQIIRANFEGVRQQRELYDLNKKYFGRLDSWLDRCVEASPRWLAEERVARIVADELHALDGERYLLMAYSLMPNHAHIVLDTADYGFQPSHQGVTAAYPLTDTLKRLKGRTARFCNQALGRSGAFWQSESYDHVIRDMHECERVILYVLSNPVKAGLVQRWEDWKFSFCRPEFIPASLRTQSKGPE